MRTIPHWINGAPVAGGSDTIDVLDPRAFSGAVI